MTPDAEDASTLAMFESENGEISVSIDRALETAWATQREIAHMYGCTPQNITQHLGKIYADGELSEESTCKKDLQVQIEGGREVKREVVLYNVDAILAVGYRINSRVAIAFRQWVTHTLKQFVVNGYVVNEVALATHPTALSDLEQLVRKYRCSEATLFQTVRDVMKEMASDYEENNKAVNSFYARLQDKFHYAATQKTAAQLIIERVDATKPNCGLTCVSGIMPTVAEAKTAKNYLDKNELRDLENICEQFILFAQSRAFRGQKMTMEELLTKFNMLLIANDYPVLYEYGAYMRGKADEKAASEIHKHRSALKTSEQKILPNRSISAR